MGRKAEVQRILLEKLMGAEAMGSTSAQQQQEVHFTDEKVCRNFLCGICPHDLFSNTKADLGTCPRSHASRLRDAYIASTAKGERYPTLETEYEDNIRKFMNDVDRRIVVAKRRIEQTPAETQKFEAMTRTIADIDVALQTALTEVERLGEAGMVEESLAQLQRSETLKQEKQDRERELRQLSETAGVSGHQKLRCCDVCGAYLSTLDSDRRLADHFGGRMHLGYVKLREVIVEFDAKRQKGQDPRSLIAAGIGWRPASLTQSHHSRDEARRGTMANAAGFASGAGPHSLPPPPPPSASYDRRQAPTAYDETYRKSVDRRRSRSPPSRPYR